MLSTSSAGQLPEVLCKHSRKMRALGCTQQDIVRIGKHNSGAQTIIAFVTYAQILMNVGRTLPELINMASKSSAALKFRKAGKAAEAEKATQKGLLHDLLNPNIRPILKTRPVSNTSDNQYRMFNKNRQQPRLSGHKRKGEEQRSARDNTSNRENRPFLKKRKV